MKKLFTLLLLALLPFSAMAEGDDPVLIDGICYEPLADEFDLSVRQIKNIIYKTESKLFRHFDT